MRPGFYVMRIPAKSASNRHKLESRLFDPHSEPREGHARHSAERWRDWVQSQHPKDTVYVMEVPLKYEP